MATRTKDDFLHLLAVSSTTEQIEIVLPPDIKKRLSCMFTLGETYLLLDSSADAEQDIHAAWAKALETGIDLVANAIAIRTGQPAPKGKRHAS